MAELFTMNTTLKEILENERVNKKLNYMFSEVTNHQFNWWFDFSPPKGYITTRPTGRCHKHFYWSAIKRYY